MNIEELFIENTTLSIQEINDFKIHIKSQNLLDWDDIITGVKYVVEEAIKADRINLLEHVRVIYNSKNSSVKVDKDSIINAPNIELL